MPTLAPTPGYVKLQCPPGVTHVYGQLDSDCPDGTAPAVYQPVNGVVTLPSALLVPDLLSQGYVILDGTPDPPPVQGWSFRDLPFLNWLGAKPF